MPQPIIRIDDLVWFDGTGDVMLTSAGLAAVAGDPQKLLDALRLAGEHRNDKLLTDAMNDIGPLAGYADLDFEEYLVLADEATAQARMADGARTAKIQAMRLRRAQFGASRAALVLRMLDTGVPYRCVHPGCRVVEDLTVDHRVPLSKGGTDDLENLQFMCLSHNASKGSRS